MSAGKPKAALQSKTLKGGHRPKEISGVLSGALNGRPSSSLVPSDTPPPQVTLREGEDLARALAMLEAERARADERGAALHAQHAAELASKRDANEEQRRYLMRTTDELRTASNADEADLLSQVEQHRAAAEAYRGQAYKAPDDAARWQGRAESDEQLLERLTAKNRAKASRADFNRDHGGTRRR